MFPREQMDQQRIPSWKRTNGRSARAAIISVKATFYPRRTGPLTGEPEEDCAATDVFNARHGEDGLTLAQRVK